MSQSTRALDVITFLLVFIFPGSMLCSDSERAYLHVLFVMFLLWLSCEHHNVRIWAESSVSLSRDNTDLNSGL
eukprot:4849352-Amphidinium_carterae.1